MNHQIAFNPFRGGNKGSVSSLPLSEYDKTIGYPWLRQMVAQIRGELPIYGKRQLGANGKVTVEEPLMGEPLLKEIAKYKSQFPFRCAHYSAFRDNKRRQANILPEAFRKRGLDIDGRALSSNNQNDTPTGVGGAAPADDRSPDGSHPIPSGAEGSQSIEAQKQDAKNLIAFDLFQEKAGLRGVNIDTEGSRHSALLAIMSAGASRVMNAEALQRVVAIRMPSFAQKHDCKQLIPRAPT